MGAAWPAFKARVSNRLARYVRSAPFQLAGDEPMVSFTFDDVPSSAATIGAPMLEDFGGRGTFYISGGLVNQKSEHWDGLDAEGILALHRSGHEIACHTFSHRCAVELDEATMAAEIAQNRRYFRELDASIRLENFAYPYGLVSVSLKGQLKDAFRSARGILPGVNRGNIDLQLLRATPLINRDIDDKGIDRVFDEALATGGWLIFYSHDVAATPSPYGCTPTLLRHALEAAKRRNIPLVTVAEALRRAGSSALS
jgi:peptidoglycan/xylan/chitin deacetylase (PgdA/CDA1 family)